MIAIIGIVVRVLLTVGLVVTAVAPLVPLAQRKLVELRTPGSDTTDIRITTNDRKRLVTWSPTANTLTVEPAFDGQVCFPYKTITICKSRIEWIDQAANAK